jgi:protein ImuB
MSLYCAGIERGGKAQENGAGLLESIARACSPRVEMHGASAFIFDASGLSRVLGSAREIGLEVQRLAAERGVGLRLALAATSTVAWLLAEHSRSALTVVTPGREKEALASLPLNALLSVPELTALSGDVRMHQAALGEDRQPIVPGDLPRRFIERLELEWPIEGLEPLSFVLARMCESLSKQLERADRGAVAITTRLALVSKAGHERTLHVPAPMRDARVLRTLILLDLEWHPPPAGIDVVEVDVEVSPGRIEQGALFVRTVPTPEAIATLTARLGALMGAARVGSPRLADSEDERQFGIETFVVQEPSNLVQGKKAPLVQMLRRLRRPAVVRMHAVNGVPAAAQVAGPWRSSGNWWRRDKTTWDRDTWDIETREGTLQRVSRNRFTKNWELDGTYD